MGYDEAGLTWSPRISAVLPYDIPGSIRLDGGQDNSNSTLITVGPSNIYSSPVPKLSEIISGSGINQIIAYLIRRGQNFLNTYISSSTIFVNSLAASFGALTYLNPNVKIKAADIVKIQAYINYLRSIEQWTISTYPFPTLGSMVQGVDIASLRKSLSIRGSITISPYFLVNGVNPPTNYGRYTFYDGVYPNSHGSFSEVNNIRNPGGNIFNGGGPIQGVGKTCVLGSGSGAMYRSRAYYQFPIYSFISAINSAKISTELINIQNTLDASWFFSIYASNTDDSAMVMTPAFGGFAWNTNVQINQIQNSSIPNTLPGFVLNSNFVGPRITDIIAKAGGRYCLIAFQDLERNGLGNGISGPAVGESSGCDVHDFGILEGHSIVNGTTSFFMDFGP